MWFKVKRFFLIIGYCYNRFRKDGCVHRAAALAYATLLSLVPLMMVSFSVLSLFPIFKGAGEKIQDFILKNFVADSADIIADHLQVFLHQLTTLSPITIGFLMLASILMIFNMVRAFNAIWHVKMERHFALSFVFYLVVLLIAPLLFGLLLVVSSYLGSLSIIAGTGTFEYIEKPLLKLLPYLSAFLTFTFFNWILPSCKVRLTNAAIAGAITAVFFELAKYCFALYLSHFPTYRVLYGALATIPIFLVWMYVSWVIILFGALVCHLISQGLPSDFSRQNG